MTMEPHSQYKKKRRLPSSSWSIWNLSLFLRTVSVVTLPNQSSYAAAFQHCRYDTERIRISRGGYNGWAAFKLVDDVFRDASDSKCVTSSSCRKRIIHSRHHYRPTTTCLFQSSQNNDNEDDSIKDNYSSNSDDRGAQSINQNEQSSSIKNNNDNKSQQQQQQQQQPNILQMINPFNAGKSLRSTVESAIDLASAIASTKDVASRLPPDRRALYYNYYVDDQLGLSGLELKDDATLSPTSTSSSSSLLSSTSTTSTSTTTTWLDSDKDYRPEVLIIGATGKLGILLVKRLLVENNVRVRVLVRDLYSNTLNKLGVGVTYCQGDLTNVESLEYAVTDVDKIIFCAGGNSRREDEYEHTDNDDGGWERLESILNERNQQAELVDGVGLRNLLHAYMNVRHSDYGPSQAAKRTLFKFRKRPADFGLFGIDNGSIDGADVEEEDDDDLSALSQCEWTKNKFGNGVFTGKVDRYGEAALSSARLRSRNDPQQGIDLSVGGFAGLVCRICSDGGVYEAFVRTEAFERLGVEYVCEFKTASKTPRGGSENRSRDKFSTVRLEFKDFLPRIRPQFQTKEDEEDSREALGKSGNIPKFVGKDIRQIGFRYRDQSNPAGWSSGSSRFYLALDFIKVYRGQPEPEFVYLSDSRIPPVVNDGMVKHETKRLTTNPMESSTDVISILDETEVHKVKDKKDRSAEETYFKYMGEEMIKQSGLSYTIIRVAGYNENQAGTDSSTVRLQKMNKDIVPVSRADLAQVVASAILEPNACNLVLYMTKSQTRGVKDGYLWEKFARLRERK